jgi:hypothetical protein
LVHTRTSKDNECLDAESTLSLFVQRLEHVSELIDALDDDLEEMNQRIMTKVGQRITGGGVVALIIKSETLALTLTRFAAALRRNELRHKLPRQVRED